MPHRRVVHFASHKLRHPASRTPARSRRALRIAPPLVRRASLPQQRALVAVRLLVEPGHDALDALGRVAVRGPLGTPSGASPSVDHWAQQVPVSSVVASRRSCPTTPSRELRARERARDALGALVRLPRHEAWVIEAVHARRAPRAAQTYVPRSPVLQIVGDARLKRSDDAVSWRCASQDIMRVLRPAFRGARAAHAGSTAWERSWRTHISIATGPNRPSRRRRPPKTKKKPRASSVGVGHVRRDKKKRGTTGIEPVTSRTRSANRALSRHVGDPGIPLDHAPISNPRPDSRCCDSTELLCCDFLGRFGL